MNNLVETAREFATKTHQRIGHLRKYTKQPYHMHLQAVAKLVSSVSDDPEIIAAAWLHDTVEDTPATLDDIEKQFGRAVADLVEELTDVSKPGDGNRARRKDIDRLHSAQASDRAKTVKLADLIDNCKDISKNDERFARVYLTEMGALLKVLTEGDATLFKEANRLHTKYINKFNINEADFVDKDIWQPDETVLQGFNDPSFKRMFMETFTAKDIAESLLSFGADTACERIVRDMKNQRREVASVRMSGSVQGYIRVPELTEISAAAECADHIRHFTIDQVVNGSSPLVDVIHVLTRHEYCFVTVLGNVAGVICRDDINKPMVRMWLFGIVTMAEMGILSLIKKRFPGDDWLQHVSEGRVQKAREIHNERQRRNLYCDLIDCLQLSDKAQILVEDPVAMERLGMESKSVAKKMIKQLESLRNHLAHAQDIVTHDWPQIVRLSMRIEELTRV